ncbi:MAG: RNA polymerase sigma factor [Ruminococcus sp.]|nr:RNA polymerase sigma factor [Ruminococcus sp.]
MTDKEFDHAAELIRQKNKEGLRLIYDEYGSYIYKTVLSVVKSPQDAEDVTSDFFLRLWQKAEQYRSGAGHKAYLAAIAHNMAVDLLKKQNRLSFTLDDEESFEEPADTVRTDETVESGISFDEALKGLSESEGEIINLHIGLELTFKEIASALGLPLGTVTWKYRNALEKLRKTVKGGTLV